MKLIFCTVFVLLFFKTDQTSRINLLCSKWKQVGLKRFGKDYKVVDESLSEVITINKNGTFEEVLYGNLKMKGLWKFSADSSKLSFALTEINALKIQNQLIQSLDLLEIL